MKFKVGDKIRPIDTGNGFEDACVIGIFTGKDGKNKGRKYYKLKIFCGTAIIPASAEVYYELDE